MDDDCPKCRGIGWVCENHPDTAWAFYCECGCIDGIGVPCACNFGDEPDASQVMHFSEVALPN